MSDARDYHEKISRLPGLPKPLAPEVRQRFNNTLANGGDILNLHLLNAHSPALSVARKPLIDALRSGCVVPRIYREIAITRAAQLVECDYEVHHHIPFCIQCGLSEEATAALANWQENKTLFDEKQLAVLGYVEEMCSNKGNISDGAFEELSAYFSPQEVLELTMSASTYYGNGHAMKALGLQPDTPDRKPAPGKF